jgi:hypothetical protein
MAFHLADNGQDTRPAQKRLLLDPRVRISSDPLGLTAEEKFAEKATEEQGSASYPLGPRK